MEPITIGMLLLAAASSAYGAKSQRSAARKEDEAGASAISAESERQRAIQEKAAQAAKDSLAEYDKDAFKDTEEGFVAKNLAKVSGLMAGAPTGASFTSKSAPTVIKDAMTTSSDKAKSDYGSFAEALARYGAQGNALGLAGLNSSGNSQTIGMLGNDSARSSAMLGHEIANIRAGRLFLAATRFHS